MIPPWQNRDCAQCGEEFLATRSEPRPANPPPVCGDCEMWERGYQDGLAAARADIDKALEWLIAVLKGESK